MPSNSSTFVAGLTAAALAAVGFLGYQASANAPAGLDGRQSGGAPANGTHQGRRNPAALPAGSGAGERVVYSLAGDRVWLVGPRDVVTRTFKVAPGSVDPPPGRYVVTSRSGAVTGTDGTPVEHVVRFATAQGATIGFSAALDGSMPEPDPTVRTGGIRESVADGAAMWTFATIGRGIVVVP